MTYRSIISLFLLALLCQGYISPETKDIHLLTDNVKVNNGKLFGWKHFELLLKVPRTSLADSLIDFQDNLDVCIYDSEDELIKRETLLSEKIRPKSTAHEQGFTLKGGSEVKRLTEDIIQLKVYKKLKTKSSHHEFCSAYNLKLGRYSIKVKYSGSFGNIETESIPLVVN